jgi:hypothetical protein
MVMARNDVTKQPVYRDASIVVTTAVDHSAAKMGGQAKKLAAF